MLDGLDWPPRGKPDCPGCKINRAAAIAALGFLAGWGVLLVWCCIRGFGG